MRARRHANDTRIYHPGSAYGDALCDKDGSTECRTNALHYLERQPDDERRKQRPYHAACGRKRIQAGQLYSGHRYWGGIPESIRQYHGVSKSERQLDRASFDVADKHNELICRPRPIHRERPERDIRLEYLAHVADSTGRMGTVCWDVHLRMRRGGGPSP